MKRAVMDLSRVFVGSSLLLSLLGCSGEPEQTTLPAPADSLVSENEDGLATRYNDLFVTLGDEDLERWAQVRQALKKGFDRICGDTICGGDYSNLRTVRLACSSTTVMRKLKDCTWVLGGSIESVDGVTGELSSEARTFTCKIPVKGTAMTMLDALFPAGEDALMTPIPATGKSFYDGLVDCFANVQGPPMPPTPEQPAYVELSDGFWEAGQGNAWWETRRKLERDFDWICGDTFCEGEYSAISPLRFACSMNVNTQHVSKCTWSFAAAELHVGKKGAYDADTATRVCEVPVDASASALAAALSVEEPLHAPLPGKTTSIYEALGGCL